MSATPESLGAFIEAAASLGDVTRISGINTPRRLALAMAVPRDKHPIEPVKLLRERRRRLEPIAPEVVGDGPGLDPRLSPARKASGETTVGRTLIDACKPFHWKDAFPRTNLFDGQSRRVTAEKWKDMLPNLNPYV